MQAEARRATASGYRLSRGKGSDPVAVLVLSLAVFEKVEAGEGAAELSVAEQMLGPPRPPLRARLFLQKCLEEEEAPLLDGPGETRKEPPIEVSEAEEDVEAPGVKEPGDILRIGQVGLKKTHPPEPPGGSVA
jgi:hypothetical protein